MKIRPIKDETDDIHGLLSMIGERLNSKYENKKKKLESQAESALKSVYGNRYFV